MENSKVNIKREKVNIKRELDLAMKNALHAQEYINLALNTVEKNDNRQLIQNTLNQINNSLELTKTSFYGYKD
ncbi:hypothetical protein [Clostridium sp.]|uniref:hypothetical protein n=1 Tax=Clostridium sp. TaxID=1506 RepID=UPI002604C771|nr:hypothetical protein [Clostridium sp.]